jgi:RNA polymerase sigma-70 factor (ECF subfamily)
MRERTDEQVMAAYAGGDMQAFEQLYQRHRGPLYRYLLRLVGDAATANDIYQGSWERVIRNRRRYRPSAPFRAWMYRIAHNRAMDHFRRTRPVSPQSPDDLAAGDPGPDAVLQNGERAARLSDALTSLPAEQREALLLKLEAGLDLAAIADVTGVNPETAKSRLRYAVAKLQRLLRE